MNASFLKRSEIVVRFLKTSKRSENRRKLPTSIQKWSMIRPFRLLKGMCGNHCKHPIALTVGECVVLKAFVLKRSEKLFFVFCWSVTAIKGHHSYNVSGDNYLVTTLEGVVAPKGAVFLGWGFSALPVLVGCVEDHPGTDAWGNRGRSRTRRVSCYLRYWR